jgi:DNA-binding IclR family transcriptional regulator
MEKRDGIKVKSLYKCLKILECFTAKTPDLGITEIAKKLELNKSNVYNMISTLVAAGYVEKNPTTDHYRLSLKMLEFSYVITSRIEYQGIVMQIMQRLSNELNHAVFFGVIHGTQVLYLYNTYPKSISNDYLVRSLMGEKAPLYCTSLGKAILSALPKEAVPAHLEENLVPFTKTTITSVEELMRDIKLSTLRGYTIDNSEHEQGIRCIGVPVRARDGRLIGGMCVSGPVQHIPDEDIERLARNLISASFEIRNRT